ncbi:helix-loop-helix DNA-binding domain-containing protein [Coniochaeta sp. 2T2.1]|nr:helix-loop-helix DNA-binding domain-containing protein [Coniochaeta sp. 2T2.1]
MAARFDDFGDDSALDNALSDDEDYSGINLADELSKIETMPQADIPQREGLYSTPLSWERPQPGIRMDQLIGFTPPSMNEAEQRRLIAIAMNPGPSMGGLGSNLMFGLNSGMSTPMGSGYGTATMSQFTESAPLSRPTGQLPARPQPKRQTSTSDKGKGNAKGSDRAAHNDIERKYRTNLKDRIAELKSAVPALQTISEDAGDEDEPSQPGRAPKVSKGTVLTKATEYIQQLERRNKQIMAEHQTLSRRLQAFEQLLAAQARPAFRVPDYSRALFDPRAFC